MYVSPKKKKQYIVAIIVGVILVVVSVFAVIYFRDIRTKAQVTAEPENIRITDVTESSAVISWVTPQVETEGWVRYSDSLEVGDGSRIAQDYRDVDSGNTSKRTTHYVLLEGLSEATSYYFEIGSGAKTYSTSEGSSFEINTPSSSMVYNSLDSITGSITNCGDQECIVYITLQDGSNVSSTTAVLVNDYGGFSAYLANIRDLTLESKFNYSDSTAILFEAVGGNLGSAEISSTVGSSLDGNSVSLSLTDAVNLVDSDDSNITRNIDSNDDSGNDGVENVDWVVDSNAENIDDVDYLDYSSNVDEMDFIDVDNIDLVDNLDQLNSNSEFRITNITENSFSVIWESQVPEVGSVKYGESSSDLSLIAKDDRDDILSENDYYIHHVTVQGLTPGEVYYYEIVSGGVVVGDVELINMPELSESPPVLDSISGIVYGVNGSNSVVVASIESGGVSSAEVSSVTDLGGNWVINLGNVRALDLDSYFNYSDSDSLNITAITVGSRKSESLLVGQSRNSLVEIVFESGGADDVVDDLLDENDLPETAILGMDTNVFIISVALLFPAIVGIIKLINRNKNFLWEKEIIRELDL